MLLLWLGEDNDLSRASPAITSGVRPFLFWLWLEFWWEYGKVWLIFSCIFYDFFFWGDIPFSISCFPCFQDGLSDDLPLGLFNGQYGAQSSMASASVSWLKWKSATPCDTPALPSPPKKIKSLLRWIYMLRMASVMTSPCQSIWMQLGYCQVGLSGFRPRKSRSFFCPADSNMTAKAHQGAWSMPPDLDSRHWYHEDAFPGYEADFLE